MKSITKFLLVATLSALLAVPVGAQIYKYYKPGSVWQITMVKISTGMDQMYLEWLDTELKKIDDAMIKAGYQKSYKILRTLDDSGEWNLLILREYASLAAIEANEEKVDALLQKISGNDDAQMKGYIDRAKYRQTVGDKIAREIILK